MHQKELVKHSLQKEEITYKSPHSTRFSRNFQFPFILIGILYEVIEKLDNNSYLLIVFDLFKDEESYKYLYLFFEKVFILRSK